MNTKLKIGYFEHWHQPPYKFTDFLKTQGITAHRIDFTQRNYLDDCDVVIVEQNGFNDFIENDESYIHNWVRNGGIMLFMHQDYMRWTPYFLPNELGHTQLIHRYIPTINPCKGYTSFTNDPSPYMTYIMPHTENPGKRLFAEPELISPDEMIDWKIYVNSFRILRPNSICEESFAKEIRPEADLVRTTAQSCFLANSNWDILGSFMDSAVKDGALIMKANYGDGMYFMNQILFPEILTPDASRCINFWKKYIRNLIAYFTRFKNGESEEYTITSKELPIKKNYKMATHMHSLDWYGCDSHPGTINALMRYMNYDIVSLAIKDSAPYDGKLNTEKYSDDKVLFLDGQEYHPFNWNDRYSNLSHNTYHTLAIGITPDAYTTRFTCSHFSDEEINAAVREAVDYIHSHGGVACATHPNAPYWYNYPYDAVDREPMTSLSGTDIEAYWLSGKKIAIMNSVDLFGVRRMLDNPAANFVYLKGEKPCRESVVRAVKAGHVIASTGFDMADVCIGDYLPGDTISKEEAKKYALSVSARVSQHEITKVRVYSAEKIIFETKCSTAEINIDIDLKNFNLNKFIRVEIEGKDNLWICNSTPFYLDDFFGLSEE